MKFVFLSYVKTPAFNRPEDWIKRIRGYAGVLEALARQHDVISIEQIDCKADYLFNGVEYHFLDFGEGKYNAPHKLHHHVKKLQPDIVLVHGTHFPLQVIRLRMLLGSKVKIIIQHHAEKSGGFLKRKVQKFADRSIHAYLFASKTMGAEWVQHGIIAKADKIKEVMEASSFFMPTHKSEARIAAEVSGHPVFLWVGRLDRNKDPLTVIKAFVKFAIARPDARLYMIYHTAELLSEIQLFLSTADKHKEAIILVGKKPHDEMELWYNAADYIISGSHYEGSGVAVCEAMSCGCIPVLTDIAAFRSLTGEGSCGVLYEAGNEIALLGALMKIIYADRDKERCKVLQQFNTHLSFEAIAGKIVALAASL